MPRTQANVWFSYYVSMGFCHYQRPQKILNAMDRHLCCPRDRNLVRELDGEMQRAAASQRRGSTLRRLQESARDRLGSEPARAPMTLVPQD
jgi:hypothetical protein